MASPIWPAVITLLSLLVMIWAAYIVGHYRKKCNIPAPAMSGDPLLERAIRVQLNTIESAIVFLPALWLAARWGSAYAVPAAGALWVAGRVLYALAYLKDPAGRSLGFSMSFFAIIVLMIDATIGLVRAALAG